MKAHRRWAPKVVLLTLVCATPHLALTLVRTPPSHRNLSPTETASVYGGDYCFTKQYAFRSTCNLACCSSAGRWTFTTLWTAAPNVYEWTICDLTKPLCGFYYEWMPDPTCLNPSDPD